MHVATILLLLALSSAQELPCRGTILLPAAITLPNVNMSAFKVVLLSDQNYMDKSQVGITQSYYLEIPETNKEYIIKPEGPNGAQFDPPFYSINPTNTINKTSCKSLNFKFMGFEFSGKVIVKNSNRGPPGITIDLTSGNEKKQVLTDAEGVYSFKGIFPGQYEIIPSSEYYNFVDDHGSISCEITWNSVEPCSSKLLEILGYSVTGHIGRALQKSIINLYSELSLDRCSELKGKEDIQLEEKRLHLLCSTSSNSKKEYVFKGLNPGHYYIMPYQEDGIVPYEITPQYIQFDVINANVVLNVTFALHLMSLTGLVSNAMDSISQTQVILQKESKIIGQATTNEKGEFAFDRLELGSYVVLCAHKEYLFESYNLELNESTSPLVIKPKKSLLSGSIPPCNNGINAKILIKDARDYSTLQTINVEDTGKFRTLVENGDYIVEPSIEGGEQNEYELQPTYLLAKMNGVPVKNMNFNQLKVNLTLEFKVPNATEFGIWVNCSSWKHSLRRYINSTNYVMEDLYPSEYTITIEGEYYCWDSKSQLVKLTRKSDNKLKFAQLGYSIYYNSKEDIPALVQSEHGAVEHVLFKSDLSSICVAKEGRYSIYPKKEFRFSSQLFYDVGKQKSPIVFEPSHYLTSVMINVDDSIPLADRMGINLSIAIENAEERSHVLSYNATLKAYYYEQYCNTKSKVSIKPSVAIESTSSLIPSLYFEPNWVESLLYDVSNAKLQLTLRKGKLYYGQIIPPIKDAKVLLIDKSTNNLIYECVTNENGSYTSIPMNSTRQIIVEAHKKGYKFTNDGDFNFKSEGLSSITVNTGIEGVKIFVSMGLNTVRENLTGSKGLFEFEDMSPGKYYIHPVLAEYTFTPQDYEIDLGQITQQKLVFESKKTLFSIKGKISNLVMRPIANIEVEVMCKDCGYTHMQEAVSMANGNYRIRKLLPNKTYIVKLSERSNVAKSIPVHKEIRIPEADIEDIDFIVLEKPKIFEIAGRLLIKNNKFNTRFNISLFNSSDAKVPMQSVELGDTMLYRFERLPKDKYTLTTSIISGNSYTIEPVQIDLFENNSNWSSGDVWVDLEPKIEEERKESHLMQLFGLLVFPTIIFIWVKCYAKK